MKPNALADYAPTRNALMSSQAPGFAWGKSRKQNALYDTSDIRDPFVGEMQFFESNPEVAGMASDDGKIVLNPYRVFSPDERQSVIDNERVRLFLRSGKEPPGFEITEQQMKFFGDMQSRGIPGETSSRDIRDTIIARILSGDPSAQDVTQEQRAVAEETRKAMRSARGRK